MLRFGLILSISFLQPCMTEVRTSISKAIHGKAKRAFLAASLTWKAG